MFMDVSICALGPDLEDLMELLDCCRAKGGVADLCHQCLPDAVC